MTEDKQVAIKTIDLKMVYNPGLFQRRKLALDGLNLDVPSGSIYGFLGQNGAGKTTTIKILVGLQLATGGQAWIRGQNIQASEARRNIGFMPENPYFYEYLTALETLEFYGRLSGMPRGARLKRSEELLEIFSLKHARDIRMREFSKGMRQRLGLAQAILHDPEVVILDEPMSGLDPLGRRDIRNVILDLRDRGRTVFFSSHILGDVADISDAVCVIHKGRQVAEGAMSALLDREVVEVKLAASGVPSEGVPKAAELATRAWHDGDLYHLIVKREADAVKAKNFLEQAGGTLRLMQPQHESLESYFIRVTGDNGGGAGDDHEVENTSDDSKIISGDSEAEASSEAEFERHEASGSNAADDLSDKNESRQRSEGEGQ